MLHHANHLVSLAANTEESYTAKMVMKICQNQVYGFVWSSLRRDKYFHCLHRLEKIVYWLKEFPIILF